MELELDVVLDLGADHDGVRTVWANVPSMGHRELIAEVDLSAPEPIVSLEHTSSGEGVRLHDHLDGLDPARARAIEAVAFAYFGLCATKGVRAA